MGDPYDLLGVENLPGCWSSSVSVIDDFVNVRGAIAHKGSAASYVTIKELKKYYNDICLSVRETDDFLLDYLRSVLREQGSLWRKCSNRTFTLFK